jgi:hypothetical protein
LHDLGIERINAKTAKGTERPQRRLHREAAKDAKAVRSRIRPLNFIDQEERVVTYQRRGITAKNENGEKGSSRRSSRLCGDMFLF